MSVSVCIICLIGNDCIKKLMMCFTVQTESLSESYHNIQHHGAQIYHYKDKSYIIVKTNVAVLK